MMLCQIAEDSAGTDTLSAAAAESGKCTDEQLVNDIAAEVRKICVDHSAGETVLHKAARLGYLVTFLSRVVLSLVAKRIC